MRYVDKISYLRTGVKTEIRRYNKMLKVAKKAHDEYPVDTDEWWLDYLEKNLERCKKDLEDIENGNF